MQMRVATPADAAAVQAIYAPVVRETPISFEEEVPGVAERAERIRARLVRFPWLVGVEALGFTPVARYRDVGFKLGRWHDVGYWQRALRPAAAAPAEPRVFDPTMPI